MQCTCTKIENLILECINCCYEKKKEKFYKTKLFCNQDLSQLWWFTKKSNLRQSTVQKDRVTRALETMQCRKAGIINLSTKEETERFLYCFYLKEEFCLWIRTALLNQWVITCKTESHKKGNSCSYFKSICTWDQIW